jgi:hypothetical protein
VIARNTAFTFKGKNIDTKEISKELGVRYVLEGSVQRDQNRVRVNATFGLQTTQPSTAMPCAILRRSSWRSQTNNKPPSRS